MTKKAVSIYYYIYNIYIIYIINKYTEFIREQWAKLHFRKLRFEI